MTTFLLALVVAILVQPPLLVVLRRARVLDNPSHRSSHSTPTLRGGGVGVVVAIVITVAIASSRERVDPSAFAPAVTVLVGLALLGLVEDVCGVTATRRLAGQLVVGAAAGAAAVAVGSSMWVLLGVTVAVVVYANAFNFMDGVNGISAMNACFAGLAYAAFGVGLDAPAVTVVGLAVAGAACGFLPFNLPSARVFLGDSGSYALGGVLAVLAIQCRAAGAPMLLCGAPVSIYLVDTGWTLWRRRSRGESLTTSHRDHAYQRLADTTLGHAGAAAVTVAAAALVTAVTHVAASSGHAWLSVPVNVIVLVAYIRTPYIPALAPTERASGRKRTPPDGDTSRLAETTSL